MNKNIIYIVGATVLVGGAYLFLKNKKAKDLAELDKLGGETSGGATSSLSTTSDGVSPSDANINLTNASALVGQRAIFLERINFAKRLGGSGNSNSIMNTAQNNLNELDKKLANLGYKVDAIGQLVKI
jgi:hypothetical protein